MVKEVNYQYFKREVISSVKKYAVQSHRIIVLVFTFHIYISICIYIKNNSIVIKSLNRID